MNQFIFKSRWIAIAFAVLTLASVYGLLGGEHGLLSSLQGDLVERRDATAAQLAEVAKPAPPPPPATEEPYLDDAEFMGDEDLIDDASGIDPTPEGSDGVDYGDASPAEPVEMINGIPVVSGEE